jgi:hypothetical protein
MQIPEEAKKLMERQKVIAFTSKHEIKDRTRRRIFTAPCPEVLTALVVLSRVGLSSVRQASA